MVQNVLKEEVSHLECTREWSRYNYINPIGRFLPKGTDLIIATKVLAIFLICGLFSVR